MHLLIPLSTLLTLTQAAAVHPRQTKTTSTESLPNPIAQTYPDNVTGTINSTIAVIPIPYSLARSIIPAKYGILRSAYEGLLENLPADTYPVSRLYRNFGGLGKFDGIMDMDMEMECSCFFI